MAKVKTRFILITVEKFFCLKRLLSSHEFSG